jgi:O-antigen/teichoic acid export membrane protein
MGAQTSTESTVRRSRRAALGLFTGTGFTAITIVVGILARPVLLKLLGEDRMGAARVSGDLMGHLFLLDFGFSGAIAVLMLKLAASGKVPELRAMIRWSRQFLLRFALLIFAASLIVAWFIPYLINVPGELFHEMRHAALLGTVVALLMPLAVYRTALESLQFSYIVNIALIAQSLLITGLLIALAWCGLGLLSYPIATIAGMIAYLTILIAAARRRVHHDETSSATESAPAETEPSTRLLWPLAWPLLVTNSTSRVNQFTDTFIIARLFNVAGAFQLDVTQTLIRLAGGQINALANVSWAALAEIRTKFGETAFEARLVELVRLVIGLGIVLTGTVAAFNQRFVTLWVGGEHYGGQLLSIFTWATVTIFGFFVIFSFILDTGGHARARLPSTIASAVAKIALSIALGYQLGIAGVVLGTAIAYLLTEAWYCPYLVCRLYKIRARVLLKGAVLGALTGAPFAAIVWTLLALHTPPYGWFGLLAEMSIACVAAVAYAWVAILDRPERLRWRQRWLARYQRPADSE